MKVILKDSLVLATHNDEQNITIEHHYPSADEIIVVSDSIQVKSGDPDPRTTMSQEDLEQAIILTKELEASVYSRPVDGLDELTKAKLAKLTALKTEARRPLAWEMGDLGDNLTDAIRTIVLGRAIENGYVTDPEVIEGFDQYCNQMVDSYGGGAAILQVLIDDALKFQEHIVNRYYPAKAEVDAATTVEEVEAVQLPAIT